jgi:hypothetical protein
VPEPAREEEVVVRLRWQQRCRLRLTAVRAGPMQDAPCSFQEQLKSIIIIIIVLQKCCVQVLDRITGGGAPGGGIIEVVA